MIEPSDILPVIDDGGDNRPNVALLILSIRRQLHAYSLSRFYIRRLWICELSFLHRVVLHGFTTSTGT